MPTEHSSLLFFNQTTINGHSYYFKFCFIFVEVDRTDFLGMAFPGLPTHVIIQDIASAQDL